MIQTAEIENSLDTSKAIFYPVLSLYCKVELNGTTSVTTPCSRRDQRKSKFGLRPAFVTPVWRDEVRILIFDRMTEN
jgi:hypothetical protein